MAKAAVGLPAAVGYPTRGFESLPSPPTFLRPIPFRFGSDPEEWGLCVIAT